MKKFTIILMICLVLLMVGGINLPSFADQYFNEQASPTEYGHVEATLFSSVTRAKHDRTAELPAYDITMGLLPNLEGELIIPAVLAFPPHESKAYGYGDIEANLKWRFLEETSTLPQVALFPSLVLPIGDEDIGLGDGSPTESLSLWVQKSWGEWTISGGGGYALSQASDMFNYGFGGVLVQREIVKNFTLGGELYAQGSTESDNKASLLLNLGGTYEFMKDLALLFSAGHSIAGEKTLVGYVGVEFTWGGPCS